MRNSGFPFCLILLQSSLTTFCDGTNLDLLKWNVHKVMKRRSAFQLAYIEATFEDEENRKNRLNRNILNNNVEDSSEICKEQCNDDLRKGLDMVKAHLGFGSVGVPAVVDEYDLLLYCRLDMRHDRCLRKCGFTVQFNMRDFICKKNYRKMRALLPCYKYASSRIKSECGTTRCGTLNTTDASFSGYGNRCRVLACDLNCMRNALIMDCGEEYGTRAVSLLARYVREQVNYWMKTMSTKILENYTEKFPHYCKPLVFQRFG